MSLCGGVDARLERRFDAPVASRTHPIQITATLQYNPHGLGSLQTDKQWIERVAKGSGRRTQTSTFAMELPFMKPPQLRPSRASGSGAAKVGQRNLEEKQAEQPGMNKRGRGQVEKPVESPKRRALEPVSAMNSPRPAPVDSVPAQNVPVESSAVVESERVQPDKVRRRARFLSEQSTGPDPELLDSESVPSLAAPTNPEADAYAKMAAQYLEVGGEANEKPARDAVEAGLSVCPGHAECTKLQEVLDAQYGPVPDAANRGSLMMNDLQFSVHAPTDVEARWADELREGKMSTNRWRNMHSVLSEHGWEKWSADKRQATDTGDALVGLQVAVDGYGFGQVLSFQRGKFNSKHHVLFTGDNAPRELKLLRKGLQWLARAPPTSSVQASN